MSKKYSSVHYHDYLQLNKILESQAPKSKELGKEAHDETLFIITHQVYELWFKEIIHDLNSVLNIYNQNIIDEKSIGVAVSRLERIVVIQNLLIDQVKIIETMTPSDFLDFRNYLLPASGFQSFQFRVIELALGLKNKSRITYNKIKYQSVFTSDQQDLLKNLEDGNSLLQLLNNWLERMPFFVHEDFNFLDFYANAVVNMLKNEKDAINAIDYLSDEEKELRCKMLGDTDSYFATVLDPKKHNEFVKQGKLHLSHKATIAALFITLYRDEPILRMPYLFLKCLVEIDEAFTTWRYRHAQMVLRMLGKKIGTGGSSGYDYLQKTTETHRIFTDLHNVSTLLIPNSKLPELPEGLIKKLNFFYSSSKK